MPDSQRLQHDLLELHAVLDGPGLWRAASSLLGERFAWHILVGGTCFHEHLPMVIMRSPNAPERDEAWWRKNHAANPLMPMLLRDPDMKYNRITDSMSVEEIMQHPYYHEFMEPEGWLYSVGLFFRESPGGRLIGILAINRRPDQGDFTDTEMEEVAELHPHFEVAFRRVSALARHQVTDRLLHAVMQDSGAPMAVLAMNGETLFINPAGRMACRQWEEANADPVSSHQPVTVPELIRAACAQRSEEAGLPTPPHGRMKAISTFLIQHPREEAVRASVRWVKPSTDPWAEPVYVVEFLSELANFQSASGHSAELEKLTASEREVAEHAARGLSNKEIAVALGKQPATVKTQLETIYRKLEVPGRGRLSSFFRGSQRL